MRLDQCGAREVAAYRLCEDTAVLSPSKAHLHRVVRVILEVLVEALYL